MQGSDTCLDAMQGLMPTLLEDVPDMAVKFAVYESLRTMHRRVFRGRQVSSIVVPTIMTTSCVGF